MVWVNMDWCGDSCQIDIIARGRGVLWSVYLGAQLFAFCQYLQYSVITKIYMNITVTGVTIVEMNLTLSEDQEVLGID